MDPGTSERLRTLVQEELDWDYLVRTANAHYTMPLLYRNLNTVCRDDVPKAVLSRLERQFCLNEFKNLFLAKELIGLLELFSANGIPAIPYKGPALAAAAYGNVAFRQFGDLDILIRKHDLSRVQKLLASRGYELQLTAEEEEVFLKDRYHYHFARTDGRVLVEIHWAFTRSYWAFPIDLDRLWSRVQRVSLEGTSVDSFHPEDLLVILCAHAAKHYWERLAWICDVAELVRAHREMDWDRVLNQASDIRSERILLLGLLLAREFLDAPLPKDILKRTDADPEVGFLCAQVSQWIFAGDDNPPRTVQRHLFYLKMRERWQDKVSHICHHAPIYLRQAITPNEKDRASVPLPDSLSFLYYPLRPIRLAKEYGLAPLMKSLRRK